MLSSSDGATVSKNWERKEKDGAVQFYRHKNARTVALEDVRCSHVG